MRRLLSHLAHKLSRLVRPCSGIGATRFYFNSASIVAVLSKFIESERSRYADRDNNRFAFSLGQAVRYCGFLLTIASVV